MEAELEDQQRPEGELQRCISAIDYVASLSRLVLSV